MTDRTSNQCGDSTERYYAEMESARNEAERMYFDARPLLDREGAPVETFRAGFERAFKYLWEGREEARRSLDRSCQETREALARETAALRGHPETREDCPECKAKWEMWHDQYCTRNAGRPGENGGGLPQKSGAFCSRCGGTDPACYICGSNAQKAPAEPISGKHDWCSICGATVVLPHEHFRPEYNALKTGEES